MSSNAPMDMNQEFLVEGEPIINPDNFLDFLDPYTFMFAPEHVDFIKHAEEERTHVDFIKHAEEERTDVSSNGSIFYLFKEISHSIAIIIHTLRSVIDYQPLEYYAPDNDGVMKRKKFKNEREYGYFIVTKVYEILNNAAESGATEDVALAKSVILQMDNLGVWDWHEAWETTEGLGFNVGSLKLTPKQAEIVKRVNEDSIITIKELFAEFGI